MSTTLPDSRLKVRLAGTRVLGALEQVGRNVRAERVRRGWSQEVLGKAAGLDRQTINRTENAQYGTSVENLLRIAWALNVTPGVLFAPDSP